MFSFPGNLKRNVFLCSKFCSGLFSDTPRNEKKCPSFPSSYLEMSRKCPKNGNEKVFSTISAWRPSQSLGAPRNPGDIKKQWSKPFLFFSAFCYPSCLNGGVCVAPFQCSCPLGVSGTFCQECKSRFNLSSS